MAVTPTEVKVYNQIRDILILGYVKLKNIYKYPINPNDIPKIKTELVPDGTDMQKEEYFLTCLMKLNGLLLFLQNKLGENYQIDLSSVTETDIKFTAFKNGKLIENPVESSHIRCLLLKTGYITKELLSLNNIK